MTKPIARTHGGPGAKGAVRWDFSTNANAAGPCPRTMQALAQADATRYPDPGHHALRERLAAWHNVALQRILFAASASEFIQRITAVGQRLAPGPVAVPTLAYGDYAVAASACGREVVEADDAVATLRWCADPGSPLGQDGAPPHDPAVIVTVLDAVYAPLRLIGESPWSGNHLDAVFQLHSPNKALGLPGVRGAYVIAPAHAAWPLQAWCDALNAAEPSWPLGAHAVSMLESWTEPATQAWLAAARIKLRTWTASLRDGLSGLGLQPAASVTSFLCARLPAAADTAALRRSGLAVRDTASFGLPGCMRVSAQPPEALAALLLALRDLITDTRPPLERPRAKGWCPGAHRPMASGDGLLVRIRPQLARLTIEQALGLCELSQRRGSGLIDLTNRANLQLRGVQPSDHQAVIGALCNLDLLDADATRERWPAILVAPCWQAGDDTERIATELAARLGELPALPPKFGFAVDAGPAPMLGVASADVRIERGASGGLIVRADGAAAGYPVTASDAVNAAIEMAEWFAATAGSAEPASKRMKPHLETHALPHHLRPLEPPAPSAALPSPGMSTLGPVYGVAFGKIEAAALIRLLQDTGANALRLTPNRALILEGVTWREASDFITQPADPLLHIDACPGAPSCASATVATRDLARDIARDITREATEVPRSLHISGCPKGCARAHPADITLVGRNGAFDLVRQGNASDAPTHTGLSLHTLRSLIGAL